MTSINSMTPPTKLIKVTVTGYGTTERDAIASIRKQIAALADLHGLGKRKSILDVKPRAIACSGSDG